MIDRRARDKLAELIRNLADGIITNDEFEDRLYGSDLQRSKDAAIWEIYAGGAWYMYDDLSTHKMTGKWKLPKASKEIVARWILFLKSGEEYSWPRRVGFREIPWFILSLLTFGLAGHIRLRIHTWMCGGDIEAWPFLALSDVERASAGRVYLWKEVQGNPDQGASPRVAAPPSGG